MPPLVVTALLFVAPLQDAATDEGKPALSDEEEAQDDNIVEDPEVPPGALLGSLRTIYVDENIDIKWGGRIEYDMGWFTTHEDYPDAGEDGTEFRRVRLYAEGYVDKVFVKTEYDFSNGNTSVRDMFLSWDSAYARVQMGRFKEPTSLENQTSGHLLTFMERGLPVTALTQLRNSGVMVSSTAIKDLHWAIGAFVESDGNGLGVDGDGVITTARVIFPYRRRIDRVFHLGAWGSYTPDTAGSIRYNTRPEAHLISNVADTGNIPADGAWSYGSELAWTFGPISVQSEYIRTDVKADGIPDPSYHGWYVYTGYFLTGENRNYKPDYAAFGRVTPHVNHTRGFSGAWEIAARYSRLDLDDGPSGDILSNVTVALNWYWNRHTRVALNYVYSDYENNLTGLDGTLSGLMLRFHVDW
jgi:phosphate-selective porin OprO/OprP